MKISVITLVNTVNYGTALQVFATQKFFESLGLEVEMIDYWRKDQTCKARFFRMLHEKPESFQKALKKPLRDVLRTASIVKNHVVFRSFLHKNVRLTPTSYIGVGELAENPPTADFYCTGSDQTWNSVWNEGVERSFYLDFLPENAKRIAYAVSLGMSNFSDEEAEIVIPLIRRYRLLTVREQTAVDSLAQLGFQSRLVLDPTLMLDGETWRSYLPACKPKAPYLLVYQLHNEHEGAEFDRVLTEIAEYRKLPVVRICLSYADMKKGKRIYSPDVLQFVRLIEGAEYILTDSFHCVSFAVNLNKSFSAVYPCHFNSRLDNILSLCSLNERRCLENRIICTDIAQEQFDKSNKKLKDMREDVIRLFKDYFQREG